MILNDKVASDVWKVESQLKNEGSIYSPSQLSVYYNTFRRRFGPEALQGLDGEALLETMHNNSNRDSLVYWLEFKDDEEFPRIFGGIGGGSALKFGIYRRKENGVWMSGNARVQRELTLEEAVEQAKKHRTQLIKGAEFLERLPLNGSEQNYKNLQQSIKLFLPDIGDSSWVHKYFSILYPDKLDAFHSLDYQKFHLIKLLQTPSEDTGRYYLGWCYVEIATGLNMPLSTLSLTLKARHGSPHHYWYFNPNHSSSPSNIQQVMYDENCIAIDWPLLGDLSTYRHDKASKETIQQLVHDKYPAVGKTSTNRANEIFQFGTDLAARDVVAVWDGSNVVRIGKVTGSYSYVSDSPFPHRYPIQWLDGERWSVPSGFNPNVIFGEIKGDSAKVKIEQHLINAKPIRASAPRSVTLPPRLAGIEGRIQAVLDRKRQVILYGPPGTGKTYLARQLAYDLAAYSVLGRPYGQLLAEEKLKLEQASLVRVCSFHPAYGYEDFIEGYRPEVLDEKVVFRLRDGIFKKLCKQAESNTTQRYYLLIDEINRGDIARIFGELLTLLEKDKRGRSVLLPLSGESFSVPDNVYVLGTMNTSDRSIALLDTALRRRFGFIELMPDSTTLKNVSIEGIPLGAWLDALNQRICQYVGRNARNLQIGHAFLLDGGVPVSDFFNFARIVQEDLIPLVEEYCYEDYQSLENILGKGFVDVQKERIRHELFDEGRKDDLVNALLAPCPEILTSAEATNQETEPPGDS